MASIRPLSSAPSDRAAAARSARAPEWTKSQISETIGFLLLIAIYKFLLDVSYVHVADAYEYQNFFYLVKTTRTELMSWLLLFLAAPFFKMVFDARSPSGNILSLLVLFSVIPNITVLSYRADYDITYILLLSLYWTLLFLVWFLSKPVYLSFVRRFENRTFYLFVAAALSVAIVVYSYINTGLRLHFDVIDVYDIRAEARDFVAPFGLNYIVSLSDNIVPVLAVVFLAQRRWTIFGILCVVIFINFSITGTKQLLFVPILGVAGYYGIRNLGKTYRLIVAAISLTILCIAERLLFDSSTLHTLFTYRVLFIPAELHYSYFSYFQVHDFLYYSQSILKLFASSTQENIQFVIGDYAIGDFSARANNGLFSDAYMNLGAIGVIVYPFIIVALLRVLDGAIYGLPQRMVFVVAVYVAFVLLGMTLTSALLTSGLLFLIILLYTLPRDALVRRSGTQRLSVESAGD